MNSHLRVLTAIMLSLFVHGVLMLSMRSHKIISPQEKSGTLQVTFQKYTPVVSHSLPTKSRIAVKNNSAAKEKLLSVQPVQPPTPAYLAHGEESFPQDRLQRQLSPANQQNQIMMAKRQSIMAHERELRRSSILAGLSNLSATLRPLVTEKIVCLLQADHEIKCTPAPKQETQIILRQFFELALEAHQLGIAENPFSANFGIGMGVSVTFTSAQSINLNEVNGESERLGLKQKLNF